MKTFRGLIAVVLLVGITIALVVCCIRVNRASRTAHEILGKWKWDYTLPEGDITCHNRIFLKDGGVFVSTARAVRGNRYIDFDYSGWWQVENGVFGMWVTNGSNTNVIRVGYTWRDKILKVDDHNVVFQPKKGEAMSWERVQ